MSRTDAEDANAEILMPRLSDSMEEATIVAWLKQPGESFVRGEGLVEVETDKATIVYEAEQDGVLVELLVDVGGSAALGVPIARASVAGGGAISVPPARATALGHEVTATPVERASSRARATPVARKLAAELGIALAGMHGSGPGGRIVRSDVAGAAAPTGFSEVAGGADRRVALTATQRTIAARMARSRAAVPEFTLTAEIDVTGALELRRDLNRFVPDAHVSVNDLFVKAAAIALRAFPRLNATYDDEFVIEHAHVNVGVAVATADALLVPVIKDADLLLLPELARSTRAAAERARTRALLPSELEGGTFTVSNLGMYGVSSFHAIINAPQVAILAIGRIDRRPAFDATDAVVARDSVHVSLSCDHRAVYGADAAQFLDRVRRAVELPLELVAGATVPPEDGVQ